MKAIQNLQNLSFSTCSSSLAFLDVSSLGKKVGLREVTCWLREGGTGSASDSESDEDDNEGDSTKFSGSEDGPKRSGIDDIDTDPCISRMT